MIKLHAKSLDYIKDVFKNYKEDKINFDLRLEKCIVHLYPIKDTYDDKGELNGYIDSLFFKVDIYDTVNMKKYTSHNHDSIDFMSNDIQHDVRIFKDGSTMLNFRRGALFTFTTAISVWNKNEFQKEGDK